MRNVCIQTHRQIKDEQPETINNLAKLLIQQWGGKNVTHSGKRVKTRSQSVQGL